MVDDKDGFLANLPIAEGKKKKCFISLMSNKEKKKLQMGTMKAKLDKLKAKIQAQEQALS